MKRILLAVAVVATLGLSGVVTKSAVAAPYGRGGHAGHGHVGHGHGGPAFAPVHGHHHHHHGPPVVVYPHRGHYHVVPNYRSTYRSNYGGRYVTPYYGSQTQFGIRTNNFRFGISF